ncbi:hypothetical protein CRYUN_Cryun14cG0099600 [Craigia yunnanensis]
MTVSNFRIELPNMRLKWASALKSKLEKSQFAKYFLLLATMFGTSMLIGNSILTTISVLSAVGGIKQATPAMTEDMVVRISVDILIFLFAKTKNFGGKIAHSNVGAEALFADVGHFTVLSIQISTCTIVYPAILSAYTGQASFLGEHPQYGADAFYKSVPGPLYWSMFVVAVLAAIIRSQSLISGTFSVIQQSLSLSCFPRVKVIRTSAKYQGQVYIPEVNYLLMLAFVGVTLGLRTTDKTGNAYGNPLTLMGCCRFCNDTYIFLDSAHHDNDMEIQHFFHNLLCSYHWPTRASLFEFSPINLKMEDTYLSFCSNSSEPNISAEKLQMITKDTNSSRIPGLALFYSQVVRGIPPIFKLCF